MEGVVDVRNAFDIDQEGINPDNETCVSGEDSYSPAANLPIRLSRATPSKTSAVDLVYPRTR